MTPNPNWQVTVQSPVSLPNGNLVPGYVQIDSVENGTNAWSKSPERLRREGFDIREDLARLPQGRYSLAQAQGWLEQEASS